MVDIWLVISAWRWRWLAVKNIGGRNTGDKLVVTKPMRIAIATGGRFHVLDLARELDGQGHDVRFYSFVPKKRAMQFGLPARCHVSLLPLMWPLAGWERLGPKLLSAAREKLMCLALNRAVMVRLTPCDVFIGMSGLILEAAAYARRQFGAQIYLERGSRHIESQREILAAIPGAEGPSDFAVTRELAGYALADRISVASTQVMDSFIEHDPALASKLFKNPYGVDLDQFPLRASMPSGQKTVLFVGGWTLRKSVDVLAAAIEMLPGVHLLHVGGLGDVPFPRHPRFVHHDSVPQWRLKEFYGRAHAFALASREEGLALVQAQALASGVPIVCTERTGGADLAYTPALAAHIRVAPHGDVRGLADAIAEMLTVAGEKNGLPAIGVPDRQLLSWRGYGERYARELGEFASTALQAG
jgi:starch synthase